VISCRSFSCRTSALTNAAPINSLERLKKSGVEFYTSSFCKVRALIAGQNRFSERKNLSNTSETRLPSKWRNTRKTGPLVTTSHVFWQHPPRTTGPLLPISQPISKFLRAKRMETIERGAGGISRDGAHRKPCIDKLARNFIPNGAPCPIPVALKKKRFATAAQFRAGPAGPFA
jgi:hypothetical protein